MIFGRGKFDHVADLREKLGWLGAQQLADYGTLCLTNKVIQRGEPDHLNAAFRLNSELRLRNTRQDDQLHGPRSRTETGKRRFCARAPALYNKLPPEVASLSGPHFRRTLKRQMLAQSLN